MTSRITVVFIVLSLIAAGCSANHNTAFRDFDITDGSGAMVDIKQRAILAARMPYKVYNPETKKNEEHESFIVCAEPSPDALSAYAAELAAEGGNGKVGATLAAASQETAAYVGLRTQSIQLLRDAFYRACEGYMGGALSPVQFDILTRRYQRYMVALLGIEQLTGAVKAPAVTLTTEGAAEAARSVSSITREIETIDDSIATKSQEKKAQDDIAGHDGTGDNPPSATAKETAASKSSQLQKEIDRLSKNKASLQDALANARGFVARGSTAASVSAVGMPSGRSEAALENLSTTVGEIVKEVLRTDDLNALCIANLGSIETGPTSNIEGLRNELRIIQNEIRSAEDYKARLTERLSEPSISAVERSQHSTEIASTDRYIAEMLQSRTAAQNALNAALSALQSNDNFSSNAALNSICRDNLDALIYQKRILAEQRDAIFNSVLGYIARNNLTPEQLIGVLKGLESFNESRPLTNASLIGSSVEE